MKSADYHLPGCVVLAAAVLGTRRAFDAARAALPLARQLDGRRSQMSRRTPMPWVPEGRKPAAVLSPEDLERRRLLDWARARKMAGRPLPGVSVSVSGSGGRPRRRAGERSQPGVVRARVLEVLGGGEMSAAEIAERVDVNQNSVKHHLVVLCSQGLARVVGRRKGGIGRAPEIWRAA